MLSVYMAVRVRPFPKLPPLEQNGCGPSTLISPAWNAKASPRLTPCHWKVSRKNCASRGPNLSHVSSPLHSKQALHTMLAYHGSETWMTTLTIRNVDPALKEELRVRAARHGRSMEAELRHILKEALGGEKRAEPNLAEAIRRRFLPLGGVDEIEPHPPVPVRDPPRFDR